jgi:putative tryptophan/tyrosine transport system substrate-binding protein
MSKRVPLFESGGWFLLPTRGCHAACRSVIAAIVLLLAATFTANAQSPEKVYRIGYIQTATPDEQAHLTKAFEEGLRDLGYVEGRNIVLERRFAWGRQERLPDLAADLVRLNVDVIVTGANPVIAAVKMATTTIPVVMAASRDPVGSGFIASLARPAGNITGLTSDPSPEFHGKRLELLKAAVPRATRVALLWNPAPPSAATYRKIVEDAALKLGMSVQAVEVRGRDEFEDAFAAIVRGRADVMVMDSDPVFFTARSQLVELATKHHLPAVYQAREFVVIGGLMSYGDNVAYRFRRAALYVDKILKGAKPGELPVEQSAKFEFILNLKTARQLGLDLPPSLLLRADEVIQ